ncbi:hypothetical protein GCM10009539_49380 [Cryptosporangium japonicum]|uniref:N-acetyltransferase domain-containing protein n=2 Tax=Cryptosporangium japonicum TaxID=80872 RepID=A0ABN0UQC5_9ACTN
MIASTQAMQATNSAATDEYSVSPYSSADLEAVHALATAVTGSDSYPKFLIAQLADILGPGFLVARDADARVVGYAVATPHAQITDRGVVLALVVDTEHADVQRELVGAAAGYLRGQGCKDIVFAPTTAPEPSGDPDDSPAPADAYRVRQFTPADLDDVYRVELSAFGSDPYPRLFFLQLAEVLGTGFLVAESGTGSERRVVGYLLGVLDRVADGRGWVMSVAVHALHRGRHVGWQLMEEAERYFREVGRKEVQLTVDPDNEVAVELYQHRDYETVYCHADLHGMKLSRLVMRLRLPVR